MKKIQFDSGIQAFQLGSGGVLRFNPCDPNVYARFLEAAGKIKALEEDLTAKAKGLEGQDCGSAALELLTDADKKIKQILAWVFGGDNDMDKALGGVNLLAVAGNGERVVTNLFQALQPVLVAGAESCAREKTEAAVAKAKARRAGQ